MKRIAGARCGTTAGGVNRRLARAVRFEAKGTLRLVRAGAGLGAPLEKAGGQGGVDQPDLGRRDRGAVRAGSGGFGYGGARRTSAAGLSSRKLS